MMVKTIGAWTLGTLAMATYAGTGGGELPMGDVRLHGPIGARLDAVVENHVKRTDTTRITNPYRSHGVRKYWYTEFWGKYMHSAMPLWAYTGDAALKSRIDAGFETVIANQCPDGYLGDYAAADRCGPMWDVWCQKYTMLGLLHYYDFTGDKRAIDACRRECDYLIEQVGPNAKTAPIHRTGKYAGLPSCSALEPVVWLYNRTKEAKYLDFAKFIVRAIEAPDGNKLVSQALEGVLPADRSHTLDKWKDRTKAYEMLSCYQGLVELYEATGEAKLLEAAVRTVDAVVADEMNVCGGMASGEHWFHGEGKQHLPYVRLQETCVTTTWLRLLEKLHAVTGETKYLDLFERAFYNAYLAAVNRDGSEFACYTPLAGYRSAGKDHCNWHANCCNANGPRGFVAFLHNLCRTTPDGGLALNHYATAAITTKLGADEVAFDVYTHYPKDGRVVINYRRDTPKRFPLKLRIPAWCGQTVLTVNGATSTCETVKGYVTVDRTWQAGDEVMLDFDLPLVTHRRNHHVAFTRGPVVLARDSRFDDGDVDEALQESGADAKFTAEPERMQRPDMAMSVSVRLPVGSHAENHDGALWSTVRFCDFASAGNLWNPRNVYRVWLPVEYSRANENNRD